MKGAKPSDSSGPVGIGNVLRKGWSPGWASVRNFCEGTSVLITVGRRSLSPSYEKKKNVRLRPLNQREPPSPKLGNRIGPPNAPPNWCCRKGDLFSPARLAN